MANARQNEGTDYCGCQSTSSQPAAFSSGECVPQHIRQLARSGDDDLGQAFFMAASHDGGGTAHVWLQVAVVNVPALFATHLAPAQAYFAGALHDSSQFAVVKVPFALATHFAAAQASARHPLPSKSYNADEIIQQRGPAAHFVVGGGGGGGAMHFLSQSEVA